MKDKKQKARKNEGKEERREGVKGRREERDRKREPNAYKKYMKGDVDPSTNTFHLHLSHPGCFLTRQIL
jgi:hypothetical protein